MTNHHVSGKLKISLNEIDLENRYYKLSRNLTDEKLKRSISACGIIEPPVLLERNNRYIIITGHNRISAAAGLGIQSIDSTVIKQLDYDILANCAVIKCYRNEIGPVGRARLIIIIRKDFNPEKESMLKLARDIELPAEFINDPVLPDRILNLPDGLKDYLDYKDISIKTIKNILRLPDESIIKLNEWVSGITLRANIFKNIIEYLIDIYKKNKSLELISEIDLSSIDDRRLRETYLHDRIFKLRYPQYSDRKEKSDGIIKYFNSMGFKIESPQYFEGEDIALRFLINKRDDLCLLGERLKNINMDDIKKLLELL